jgi:hypothetical protein
MIFTRCCCNGISTVNLVVHKIPPPPTTALLSSLLSGLDVAGSRDDFPWCRHLDLLCLVAKPPHVGVDVEGLHYRMHRPIDGRGYRAF